MVFSSDFLDQVRGSIELSNVIGKRIRLVQRGGEFIGLCPFHSEKTPSFTVNDDKGFYHCFGCEAHGSHFDFLMKVEGISFPEAVEQLAIASGIPMPVESPEARSQAAQKASLYEVIETAAKWFTHQLWDRNGDRGQKYLQSRGVTLDTAKEFQLGWAPKQRTALKEAMTKLGVGEERLVEAGLIINPEDGGSSFDRFRNRILFPISDVRGRTIAFGARALGDTEPKYLNSPETTLFHKGKTLYNYARARGSAGNLENLLVVEGYMDVLSLYQSGLTHVVAPLGTAVGSAQLELLWRVAPEPVLCLDGDAAGQRAAERVAHRALPLLKAGQSLRFAYLPWGEDPDTIVRKQGHSALTELVECASPLSDVLWEGAIRDGDFQTPERRAALRGSLDKLSAQITDSLVRGYYREFFSSRFKNFFREDRDSKRTRSRKGMPSGARLPRSLGLGSGAVASPAARERLLVLTLINHPSLMPKLSEELAGIQFATSELDRIARALLEVASTEVALDASTIRHHLTQSGLGDVIELLTHSEIGGLEPWIRPDTDDTKAEQCWRHVLALHRLLSVVSGTERREAVNALAKDMTESGLARLRAMQAQWEAGEGNELDIDVNGPQLGSQG